MRRSAAAAKRSEKSLARAIQDIDNVEPEVELPLYFRFLVDAYLSNPADKRTVHAAWDSAVTGLLKDAHFKNLKGRAAWMRTAFELSKVRSLSELVAGHMAPAEAPSAPAGDWCKEQLAKLAAIGKPAKCYVEGHTHGPGIWPASSSGGRTQYAVNTGCWRRLVRRQPESNHFAARDVRTMLWVEREAGGPTFQLRRDEEVR